jgi:hypothetical protein
MNDQIQPAATPVCPSCGAQNWPSARFCAECGTRLVAESDLDRAFESTVAEVIAPTSEETHTPAAQHEESAAESFAETSIAGPATVQPTPQPAEWPATVTAPAPRSRNTALWIVLGIFAFILVCCCLLALAVTITSSNDSALQRELSFLAGTLDRS